MLENKLFEALLDIIPFGAYAVDVETYDLVYANKIVRENMYAPQQTSCWEKIYGLQEICPWCTIYKLKDRDVYNNRHHTESFVEFFDEIDDKWLKSFDELISWPDGRDVKYSILVNITDQKNIQGSMIQSHAKLAVKSKQIKRTNKNFQITKLKLQKSINEFDRLFNSTIEGMMIIENNICVDVNDNFLHILSCDNKDEIINRPVNEIIIEQKYLQVYKNLYNKELKGLFAEVENSQYGKRDVLLKTSALSAENRFLICVMEV
jgi:hypothetical protein